MLQTLIALLVVYALLCGLLFLGQRSLLYFPQPRQAGAQAASFVMPSGDARLVVTTLERPGPRAVLYFGGNAEDVSQALPGLAAAYPGRSLYLLHYRGYGGSTGSPTEAALMADAQALYARVQARHPKPVVVGRSLGTGVAVQLAASRPVERLVLITPYHSIAQLAADRFPMFPVRWLLADRFESWRHAPQVSAPTLILVAGHDTVVPRASTESLATFFRPGLATLHVLPDTDHNSICGHPAAIALMADAVPSAPAAP
jgi:pimeloyl-ACP methyl ester carboxylesterase